MSLAMAPHSQAPANRFDILDEEERLDAAQPLAPRQHEAVHLNDRGILTELSIDHSRNKTRFRRPRSRGAVPVQVTSDTTSPRAAARVNRRRPVIESDTFEPLASLGEEHGFLDKTEQIRTSQQQHSAFEVNDENIHPLASAVADRDITTPIEQQLSGQFEWLISYSAPACSAVASRSKSAHGSPDHVASRTLLFGCNLLRRKPASASTSTDSGPCEADTFTFIATPLPGHILDPGKREELGLLGEGADMALAHGRPTLCTPVKMAGMIEVVEQMLSPPLTAASDRTASIIDSYSPIGSAVSSPRIEDSLAEIDKLEDELEAVNLYADTRNAASASLTDSRKIGAIMKTPGSGKRVTINAQPATVRIRSSEKVRPSLRRSSSLTLRDRQPMPLEDIPEQKVAAPLRRSASTIQRSAALSKATVKSTKAPTIANFELPGEAVARRLKEQREARQAQQAETHKAQPLPSRTQSQKPLTKSNFELPGEAISRRKREQHEAKLRAQEEEERKRREFKARPIRYSLGPSTLPRQTITSRARQSKEPANEVKDTIFEVNKTNTPGRTVQTLPRGRNSMILSPDSDSRATSVSTGSAGRPRSTLSSEDAAQQRLRGREIFVRDNSSTELRLKAKREKETAAQLARAEAAERSRALSREWAEKKRRKELSLRRAMRESMQPDIADASQET